MSKERILSLPCWNSSVELEELPGGITNRNYKVIAAGGNRMARVCGDHRILGIDRRNELVCQEAAAGLGIAPQVFYHEEGILVSDFIEARTLGDSDVREAAALRRLAQVLRQLHESRDGLSGEMLYFCPFQTVRTYAGNARELGAALPENIDSVLEDIAWLAQEVSPFRPSLCHNDVLAANILDDGDHLWLVDWEYGGMGNPLFDIAGVCGNCSLEPAQEAQLLSAYFGREDETVAREVRILKVVSLLRETLWAVIQTVASEIEFDYAAYAAELFEAYRRAREDLN